MPKVDFGNLRILLERDTDDPEEVFFCPVLATTLEVNGENARTDEDICPVGLGGSKWQIAMSKEANNGFSHKFEQKFFSQPWIAYGRQLQTIEGRTKGKKAILHGIARDQDGDKINQLSIVEGKPTVNEINTRTRKDFLDSAPQEWKDDDFLSGHQIPTPMPTILEALKVGFGQLNWHFDTKISDLPVSWLFRELLSIIDTDSLSGLNPFERQKRFGFQLFLEYLDPNPVEEVVRHFPIRIRFTDHLKSFTEQEIEGLLTDWKRNQQLRLAKTHRFKFLVAAENDFRPNRLEFHFDFCHTAGGVIWLQLTKDDLSVMDRKLKLIDLVHWHNGKRINLANQGAQ